MWQLRTNESGFGIQGSGLRNSASTSSRSFYCDCNFCKTSLSVLFQSLFLVFAFNLSLIGWEGNLLAFSPCISTFNSLLFLTSWISDDFSISQIGFVFIAPRIILSPAFCTLFNFSLFVCIAVIHVVDSTVCPE